MTNISEYVYKDGEVFYFDSENYTDNVHKTLTLDYEDGDMVKWTWEGKTMMGTLRCKNIDLGLFVIENITTY